MKTWPFSRIAIAIALFSQANPVWAAKPSDFFCHEIPGDASAITFARMGTQVCSDSKPTQPGLCILSTACGYIATDEVREQATKNFKKKFSELTTDEKRKVADAAEVEFLPSVLTCAPTKVSGGVATCPLPENCKGDVNYGLRAATFEDAELEQIKQRVAPAEGNPDPHFFEPKDPSAGAGK